MNTVCVVVFCVNPPCSLDFTLSLLDANAWLTSGCDYGRDASRFRHRWKRVAECSWRMRCRLRDYLSSPLSLLTFHSHRFIHVLHRKLVSFVFDHSFLITCVVLFSQSTHQHLPPPPPFINTIRNALALAIPMTFYCFFKHIADFLTYSSLLCLLNDQKLTKRKGFFFFA